MKTTLYKITLFLTVFLLMNCSGGSSSSEPDADLNLTVACEDKDGDGYTVAQDEDSTAESVECSYTDDCNDEDSEIFPDATEVLGDGIDQNCDDEDSVYSDEDYDGDEIANEDDNCPYDYNYYQTDTDGDGAGDECDVFPDDPSESKDTDGDGIGDNSDLCPTTDNTEEENIDTDGDGVGDICDDSDDDGDDDNDDSDDGDDSDGDGADDGDGDGDDSDGNDSADDGDGDDSDGDDGADDGDDNTDDDETDTDGDGLADSIDPQVSTVNNWGFIDATHGNSGCLLENSDYNYEYIEGAHTTLKIKSITSLGSGRILSSNDVQVDGVVDKSKANSTVYTCGGYSLISEYGYDAVEDFEYGIYIAYKGLGGMIEFNPGIVGDGSLIDTDRFQGENIPEIIDTTLVIDQYDDAYAEMIDRIKNSGSNGPILPDVEEEIIDFTEVNTGPILPDVDEEEIQVRTDIYENVNVIEETQVITETVIDQDIQMIDQIQNNTLQEGVQIQVEETTRFEPINMVQYQNYTYQKNFLK